MHSPLWPLQCCRRPGKLVNSRNKSDLYLSALVALFKNWRELVRCENVCELRECALRICSQLPFEKHAAGARLVSCYRQDRHYTLLKICQCLRANSWRLRRTGLTRCGASASRAEHVTNCEKHQHEDKPSRQDAHGRLLLFAEYQSKIVKQRHERAGKPAENKGPQDAKADFTRRNMLTKDRCNIDSVEKTVKENNRRLTRHRAHCQNAAQIKKNAGCAEGKPQMSWTKCSCRVVHDSLFRQRRDP